MFVEFIDFWAFGVSLWTPATRQSIFLPLREINICLNVSICTRKFVTHNVLCEQKEEREREEVENVIQVLFPIQRLAAEWNSFVWKRRNYFNCFIHKWTYMRCSHNIYHLAIYDFYYYEQRSYMHWWNFCGKTESKKAVHERNLFSFHCCRVTIIAVTMYFSFKCCCFWDFDRQDICKKKKEKEVLFLRIYQCLICCAQLKTRRVRFWPKLLFSKHSQEFI